MRKLSERRLDAWTTLAAEPAVRAAERAIVTGSPAVLAGTLAVSTTAESRRRLAHVLELKAQADRVPERRDAYRQAADDLRSWAATVYLAALREPRDCLPRLTGRPGDTQPSATPKARNPYTEESISLRRSVPRPPFPGQRRRRPFDAGITAEIRKTDRPVDAAPEPETAAQRPSRRTRGDRARGRKLRSRRCLIARSGSAALWMGLAPDSARTTSAEPWNPFGTVRREEWR